MKPLRIFISSVQKEFSAERIALRDWLRNDALTHPYSHPSSPNIPKQEVTDAITAVTTFLDLVAKK